jgi:hypothetical protein
MFGLIAMRTELLSSSETPASRQSFQPCSMMSAVAKSSSARKPPEVEVPSPITSINYSIAIDPIEYIRMPSSFYYFEPDGDIVDYDWMPGKPSSPLGPVFGFYFHFIHPFIVVRDATSRPDYELDFSRSELLMSCREYVPPTAVAGRCRHASRACVTLAIIVLCLSERHGRIVAKARQSRCLLPGMASRVPSGYHRAYVFART